MKYSVEKAFKIYNDDTGAYIEVSQDPDGLDMIEIIYRDPREKIEVKLPYIEVAQVRLLIDSLTEISEHMASKEKNNE